MRVKPSRFKDGFFQQMLKRQKKSNTKPSSPEEVLGERSPSSRTRNWRIVEKVLEESLESFLFIFSERDRSKVLRARRQIGRAHV